MRFTMCTILHLSFLSHLLKFRERRSFFRVDANLHAAKCSHVFVSQLECAILSFHLFIQRVLAQSYLKTQGQLHLIASLAQPLYCFCDFAGFLNGRVNSSSKLLNDLFSLFVNIQNTPEPRL